MAPRMIPAELPAAVLQDSRRAGEVAVYEALRGDPLLEGFTVWYSPKWLAAYDGVLRDGEADFIAAHPDLGFITLEVKGGRVRRDALDRWTSRDRNGDDHHIEDPVAQAMKSKKVLLAYMLRGWKGRAPFIWNRHGVILPHASRPAAVQDLGAAMPLEIFAFREDMVHLGARIMQMLLWQPEGVRRAPGGLGAEGIRQIEAFCGRDVTFDIPLAAVLAETEQSIVRLTEDQNRLLDTLRFLPRAHFRGGAGTGKTTLALEKARRLAAEGRSVLLLCYNRPLRNQLATWNSEAEVMTFHELCGRAVRQAGVDSAAPAGAEADTRFLMEVLPAAFEDAVLSPDVARYDAVLIDEAQDFRSRWIDAISCLLPADGSGTLHLFSDDNQNLYAGGAPAQFGTVLPLVDNFRNARPVFDVSARFYLGETLRCCGPAGPDVRWISTPAGRGLRVVERQLNSLILGDRVPPGDIAVLTGGALNAGMFAGLAAIGEHPVCSADRVEPAVTLDTVRRFKGLERPVVILTEMEGWMAEPELAYVGLSRAKSLLIVVGAEATLQALSRGPQRSLAADAR